MKPAILHPYIRLFGLFVFAMGLHLSGTWILPLLDRDEPRFSEASREMAERGDWVLPTFNNLPRYDKPPLTYWSQMLAYRVFGQNDFAARFHSAFFTALTALAVYGFCSRLYNPKTAWVAAVAFTLSLQVMIQAKAAVADMPMVCFVTLATWAGWELMTAPSRFWWWTFYGSLALGFLAKGPIAWVPIGSLLLYARWNRISGINRSMKFQFGLPLVLLLISLWGLPAVLKTHGEFFSVGIGKHVVQRSFSSLEGHGGSGVFTYLATLPFYFVTVFVSFLPWSIFSKEAWLRVRHGQSRADGYLVCCIVVTFAIFTLVKTKLPHYVLPAFPMLACLFGPVIGTVRPRLFTGLAAGMAGFNLVLSFILFPIAGRAFLIPIKSITASSQLPTGTEFASVEYDEPSQVWYFRKQLSTWHKLLQPEEVVDYMSKPAPRLCILPQQLLAGLPRTAGWEYTSFAGHDIANGKTMALTMILKR